VYLGTASKTLAPALRLAWMALPERLVDLVAQERLYRDMHTEHIGQLTLANLVTRHGYDRHVRACRLRYRRRRDALVTRLSAGWARRFAVQGVAAGLHAMVRLPPGCREEDVVAAAAGRGLALDGLRDHWHAPGEHPQHIIVGYATPAESAYPAALDTLIRVLRAL
jgi:GntR family transcriptional regulator/MocR family aminotransferase